jgi:glutathione S-transferase
VQKLFTPEDKRRPEVIDRATDALQRPLRVLDAALAGRDWLVGEQFSIADLNVAGVMLLMKAVRVDIRAHANVMRWADACYAREGLRRASARA